MERSIELEELLINPPAPEEIAEMPQKQRNKLLSYTEEDLNRIFPGFSNGEMLARLHKGNEQNWIPSESLMNASLFAGQGSAEGLAQYIYEHIDRLSVQLKNPDTGEIQHSRVPTENILKSLSIVERLLEGSSRRTGEPVIAHIYRTFLRTERLVDYYNDMYNEGSNPYTGFPPDIAELMYIVANLHDFGEDKIPSHDGTIHTGSIRSIPNFDPKLFFLRREQINPRGKLKVLEDLQLDIKPEYIQYLENALIALNGNDVAEHEIIERILRTVKEQSALITGDMSPRYVLSSMPLMIKTGADRPDNLATYFTMKTVNMNTPTPVKKLIIKARENLDLFQPAEQYLHIDTECCLSFSPTRWAKLILLGLTPDQMYTVAEDGGLPELI